MDNFWTWMQMVGVSAIGAFLFGPWVPLMGTLAVFMFADIITGFYASAKEGRINSKVGHRGGGKKVLVWVIVSICFHLDSNVFLTGTTIRDSAIMYFTLNELISITENTGRAGLPLPDKLKVILYVLEGKKKDTKKQPQDK